MSYDILFNGGTPYRAVVKGDAVSVYREDKEEFGTFDAKPFITFHGKVHVGASPENHMTTQSGGFGEKWLGNSILVEEPNGETMVLITSPIQRFKKHDRKAITRFLSPVGNSAVSYPFAEDAAGNLFLFGFERFVKGGFVAPLVGNEDPYSRDDFKHPFTTLEGELIDDPYGLSVRL
jgi:hypothetical protein